MTKNDKRLRFPEEFKEFLQTKKESKTDSNMDVLQKEFPEMEEKIDEALGRSKVINQDDDWKDLI